MRRKNVEYSQSVFIIRVLDSFRTNLLFNKSLYTILRG